MGIIDATRTCFSKYATFSGRASRPEYWWFYLFVLIASLLASGVDYALFGTTTVTVDATAEGAAAAVSSEAQSQPLTSILGLVCMVPLLAAGWRRAHDVGKPGWYILLPGIAAFVGLFGLLIGVAGFGIIETLGGNPDTLRGMAAILGVGGMVAIAVAVVGLTIYKIVLLARPSEPEINKYGAPTSA